MIYHKDLNEIIQKAGLDQEMNENYKNKQWNKKGDTNF